MGRKDLYESLVVPNLDNIKEWCKNTTEGNIARKLGVTQQTFEKYKRNHPELREALQKGKAELVSTLRETMLKKAKGYYYKETRTTVREENGKKVKETVTFEKFAQPDTGALHLLLKNLDDSWRNDDKQTMELKQRQVEVAEKKADEVW